MTTSSGTPSASNLTHAFEPKQAVWPGFGNAVFKPAVAGRRIEGYADVGEEFTCDRHGFVATAYETASPSPWAARAAMPAMWPWRRLTGRMA
jgi:hypothetical protein